MKKKLIILILGMQMLGATAMAKTQEVRVAVKGMVCSFCAQGIKKKFSSEEAVKKVNVSLENHLVALEFQEGKELSDETITDLLKDAGYTVEKIER